MKTRGEAPALRSSQPIGGELGRPALQVLIVIDSLGLGGAESLLLPLVRAAPSVGISFDVVSVAGMGDQRREMIPPLTSLGVTPYFLESHRLLAPWGVPRLVGVIRRTRCDVVHAHLENAITLSTVASRLTGRPAVCTFHHNPHEMAWRDATREQLAISASGRCAQTIFVSEASRREWAARYRPRPNWTVLANGIDLRQWVHPSVPACLPADLEIPTDVPVALLPASMRGGKGHEVAIAAWPRVLTAVPDARLLLVGSGPTEEALRAQVRSLDLGRSVVFAGFRTDMPRLVQGSALVLLPSEAEAFPTVLLEAAAGGRCVVASTAGGTPEVVKHGETGLLVDPADTDGLAVAVIEMLTDPSRREQLGRAARLRASENFGSERWVARLRAVYDAALDHPGPGAPA